MKRILFCFLLIFALNIIGFTVSTGTVLAKASTTPNCSGAPVTHVRLNGSKPPTITCTWTQSKSQDIIYDCSSPQFVIIYNNGKSKWCFVGQGYLAGAWSNATDWRSYCSGGWIRAYKNGIGSTPYWDDSAAEETMDFPYNTITQVDINATYC